MTATASARAPRLLVISGSARTGSYNRQLAEMASRRAQALGAETTVVDLRALELPVYDEDWAQAHGKPAGARRLRDLFADHDGLILSSPEYNALPTPLFINSFDWLSVIPAEDGKPSGTGATGGKPVGLLAASPGALGGIRALPIVRTYLSTNFAMVVVPEQLALPLADQQLTSPDRLAKPELDAVLDRVVASVVKQARWRIAGA